MITKKEFCQHIIQEEMTANNETEFKSALIYMSSSVAVCAEYLGLLKTKQDRDYASFRGGSFVAWVNEKTGEHYTLSTRELVSLLPETR